MSDIRIQDDLYNFVNHDWLEKAVIPSDKPTTGGFADLDTGVEKLLINDLNQMSKDKKYPNAHMERVVDLFSAVKDVKKRKKFGVKPALKNLAQINDLKDIADLNSKLKDFALSSFPLPFAISVQPDMKDTKHYCLNIAGPSTILPDTTYYKEEMKAQHDQILGLWLGMTTKILTYSKLSKKDQKTYLEDTVKFDAVIATLVKSQEEWADYVNAYNPLPFEKVEELLKPLAFNDMAKDLFGFVPATVVVNDPRFLEGFKTLFNEETFTLYKHWAYVTELVGSTAALSEDLRALGSTYRNALMGVGEVMPLEKYAYRLTGSFYSQPLGLYYGEKYFGEEAKKDIIEIVNLIIKTYKKRIKDNDILEESTKKKAIKKLSTMKVKMGYPDKVGPLYDKLVFNNKDSLYDICATLGKIKTADNFAKLGQDVDKTEWGMPGNMVNACYDPTANDITFPAAILQAPFYSVKQTRSQNLGGIGAVIGHEISHAFDNNGAKCDENGNLNNWWTEEDTKKFNARTKAMIKEFDGIELPWGKVNGSFIVSENIADNGGMAVTLEIMSSLKNANYEEYFTNWARIWCMKAREEYLKLILKIDVHAPTILRANMQPRNFEEWYKTFDVKKTDKMYLAPSKRVVIW